MNYFEREFLASERIRERLHEASHERLAHGGRRTRPTRQAPRHATGPFAMMRRLVRAGAH